MPAPRIGPPLAVLFLLGCGAPATAPAVAETTPEVKTQEPAPAAVPALPPPPLPDLLKLDGPTVCALSDPDARSYDVYATQETSGQGMFSSFSVQGVARAEFDASGKATLEVRHQAADGTGYLVVGAFNRAWGDVHLKPGRGSSQLLDATSATTLRLKGFVDGAAVLVPSGSQSFKRKLGDLGGNGDVAYEIPEVKAACDALSLAEAPEAALPTALGAPALKGGAWLRLYDSERAKDQLLWVLRSDQPAGAASLSDVTSNIKRPPRPVFDGPPIEVLERRGKRVKARFFASTFKVEGWVDADDVGKRDGAPWSPPPRPSKAEAKKPPSGPVTRCPHEIPILGDARLWDGYPRLGTLFKDTPFFAIGEDDRGIQGVVIEGVTPRAGGTWPSPLHVRSMDIKDCTTR